MRSLKITSFFWLFASNILAQQVSSQHAGVAGDGTEIGVARQEVLRCSMITANFTAFEWYGSIGRWVDGAVSRNVDQLRFVNLYKDTDYESTGYLHSQLEIGGGKYGFQQLSLSTEEPLDPDQLPIEFTASGLRGSMDEKTMIFTFRADRLTGPVVHRAQCYAPDALPPNVIREVAVQPLQESFVGKSIIFRERRLNADTFLSFTLRPNLEGKLYTLSKHDLKQDEQVLATELTCTNEIHANTIWNILCGTPGQTKTYAFGTNDGSSYFAFEIDGKPTRDPLDIPFGEHRQLGDGLKIFIPNVVSDPVIDLDLQLNEMRRASAVENTVVCTLLDMDGLAMAKVSRNRAVAQRSIRGWTLAGRLLRHPFGHGDAVFGAPFIWSRGNSTRCGMSEYGKSTKDGAVLDAAGQYLGVVEGNQISNRAGKVVAHLGQDCLALPLSLQVQYASAAARLTVLHQKNDAIGDTFLMGMDLCTF